VWTCLCDWACLSSLSVQMFYIHTWDLRLAPVRSLRPIMVLVVSASGNSSPSQYPARPRANPISTLGFWLPLRNRAMNNVHSRATCHVMDPLTFDNVFVNYRFTYRFTRRPGFINKGVLRLYISPATFDARFIVCYPVIYTRTWEMVYQRG
jgi:hypothetical protein